MVRTARYTERISALLTPEQKERIDAIEQTYPLSQGDVIREAINAGIEAVEERYPVPRAGRSEQRAEAAMRAGHDDELVNGVSGDADRESDLEA